MNGEWKEVVRLAFEGPRFRDHALDLSAITELSQFQKLVAETAKAQWRSAHPDRERVPKNFEDRTRLCLRRIDDGSAIAPLEVYVEEREPNLFGMDPTEANEAVELARSVFRCVQSDEENLPENFPRHLIPEYEKFGQSLDGDDAVRIQLPGSANIQAVVVTQATRTRLSQLAEQSYEDTASVTGEVLEADVRQRRFQVWVDNRGITASFSQEQESEITSALRDHRSVRLQITGKGEFSHQGKPLRFTQVDELRIVPVGTAEVLGPTGPAIEDILAAIAREIPASEWQRLPSDLSDNLDHYIYGTPKQ